MRQKLKFWKPVSRLFKRRIWKPVIRKYGAPGAVGVVIVGIILVAAGGGAVRALLLGATSSSISTGVNLDKGLIGYWKMDGSPADSSTSHTGSTLVNSAPTTTDRKGKANGAYSFNGTNQYITMTNTSSYDMGSRNWSISAWVQTTAVSQTVVNKRTGGPNQMYQLTVNASGQASISMNRFTTPAKNVTSTTVVSDGNWHLITATLARTGNMSLYVDGNSEGTVSIASEAGSMSNTFLMQIGRDSYLAGSLFTGKIDDVRIYDRVLNASEATALYGQYDSATKVGSDEKGLVGQWNMDGNAKDTTPYRNNGSLVGTFSSTSDRKGAANSAYNFDGTTNNIDVPNSTSLDIRRTITLSAWVYPTSYGGKQWVPIIYKGSGSSSTNRTYSMWLNSSGYVHVASMGTTLASASGTISLNQWQHIVGVIDKTNGTMKIYINGNLIVSGGATVGDTVSATNPMQIGWTPEVNSQYGRFLGKMDDVRIYNRTLTSTEISNQYKSYNSQINVGGSGQSGSISLSKGLVGQWSFSGNPNDSTPNRNNGVVTSSTLTTDRRGIASRAYNFSNSWIQVPASTKHKPTSGITLSAWIYPTDLTTGASADQQIMNTTEGGGWALMMTNTDQIGVLVMVSGSYRYATVNRSTLTANQWTHMVGTYDGSNVKLYVNGALVTTTAFSGVISYGVNNPVCIGAEVSATACSTQKYWKGKLDELNIYNRALSAAEVTALYQLNN